jgi:ribonuclease HI
VEGVGGSLFYPRGNIETSYSWGLGAASNNIAKTYSLFKKLKLVREKKINNLTAFKDSMIVASVVINQTQIGTNLFNETISQVIAISHEFESFQLYHVK